MTNKEEEMDAEEVIDTIIACDGSCHEIKNGACSACSLCEECLSTKGWKGRGDHISCLASAIKWKTLQKKEVE